MKRFILALLFTALTPILCLAEQLPAPRQKVVEGVNGLYFGMDATKLRHDGKPHYHLNGREVEKHHVVAALTLSDDSAKPFVTFIGEGCHNSAVKFLTTPEATKCRVNAYDAGDWHVTGGFVTSGSPTVYVQRPTGEVLYRGDNPALTVVQAEARKAQPDYDPMKDPDGMTPPASDYVYAAVDFVNAHRAVLLAIVAGIGMLYIFKRS